MMRTLSKWKGEGWSSLWKGQLTTCCWDACSASIQPLLLTPLTLIFLPTSSALAALPLMHSAHPGPLLFLSTLSHVVTTVFLSPVDLIRTRLIVQSAQPQHRKYSGPLDAFNAIIREEGGLYTTYFHPHLLFPALLEGIVRPLIFLATPLIISRSFHIEPSSSPILFACAEFILGSLGLLITIPVETVRKRLQIQTRAPVVRGNKPGGGTGRPWRTCVETRDAPYAGMVDAVYRILTEETGRIPRRNRRRSSFNSAHPGSPTAEGPTTTTEGKKEDLGELGAGMGLRQLYRGLGMGIGANVVVLLLGVLAGGADDRLRWTEM
jgi:fusion and transport protein UGO1